MKNRNLTFVLSLLLIATILPSLAGFLNQDPALIYSGVVFNPIDGYTYLAKMQIGKSGDWLFTLPFTPVAGEGRFLYPFYIYAGHCFKLLGISLSLGFNILRLVSSSLLILSLAKLSTRVIPNNHGTARLLVILLAFGGGLGWLLLPFGHFGSDFWVAEAFPFLSSLANPHFPLALCLMTFSVIFPVYQKNRWIKPAFFLSGLALSIVSPFGFVLSFIVLALSWLWERIEGERDPVRPLILYGLSGIPYCGYQYWAVQSTPQLAAWTAQNLTPSPAIWDVLLTFSPWLILTVVGWKELLRLHKSSTIRRLIIWLIVGLVFSLVPFSLQRRFMIGLSIPFTALGLLSLPAVAKTVRISAQKIQTICTAVVLITPVLLVVMTTLAIASHNPLYYYYKGEVDAITWLSEKSNGKPLVLASGETGMMIPSISRLRVVYGHPFETIQAESSLKTITAFFKDEGINDVDIDSQILKTNKIDWVIFGLREKEIGSPKILSGKTPAFISNGIALYKAEDILR